MTRKRGKSVKTFKEPETIRGWWDKTWMIAAPSLKHEFSAFNEGEHIRIIRERDLQKLLKLARGKK